MCEVLAAIVSLQDNSFSGLSKCDVSQGLNEVNVLNRHEINPFT